MNAQHKTIRALLQEMAPNRAIAFIKAFNLPEDEERCLIDCDVRRLCYAQIITDGNRPMSAEAIKKKKRSAYAHIADEMNNA